MISTVILARDERDIIGRCIDRCTWCDDIYVVLDPGSSDGTRELLASYPVHTVEHRFEDFASQRNWALEAIPLKHPWVLMLDADELVTPAFTRELNQQIAAAGQNCDAMAICRKTLFLGRWIKRADGFPVWIMRVVRRSVRFQSSGHGEVPLPLPAERIKRLSEPLEHYAFYKGLPQWLERHNKYSSREAAQELAQVPVSRFRNLLSLDSSVRRRELRNLARHTTLRPLLRFLYQYLFRGGFLEGREGFLYCMLLASYESNILVKRIELERGRSLPSNNA
jgi:glycosyltransferase involved in cell wall biosynthesis